MSIEITLFSNTLYLELPQGLIDWLGWLALLGAVAFSLWRWRGYNKRWKRLQWVTFIILLILTPLASLFLVVRLPVGPALPPPGLPSESHGPALVLFIVLPWLLAAGLLGPIPAAILAALSGVALMLWDTHNVFTPLEMALLGVLMGAGFQQRYRTLFFTLLRHPFPAAILMAAVYPLFFLYARLFSVETSLASRLDFGLTQVIPASLAVGASLMVAGLFAEGIALSFPGVWGRSGYLLPSPVERRLHTQFLFSMAPLGFLLIVTLMVGDWVVAGNAARELLRDRMASTAQMAAEAVPFFLEAGQNLIQQLAEDERLYQGSPEEAAAVLQQGLQVVPFFTQLYVIDNQGNPVTGYPSRDYNSSNPSVEELRGIETALNGVAVQYYAIPPVGRELAAQVSFLALILDQDEQPRGVLIGRTDLSANPLTQPILSSLNSMAGSDGDGLLLDGRGRILYHSNADRWIDTYTGKLSETLTFFNDTAPDGTRRLVYYRPAVGQPWAVVLSIPARRAQQVALNIAAPLLIMLVALFVMAGLLLRLGLRVVTASLQNLALEANRIASGQLDHPLQVEGEDEVGQLRRSFEQMRASLKSRLEEINRLLAASQGVASSLEMEEAVQPLLDAILATGASAARVVLEPAAVPEVEADMLPPRHFGIGPASDIYSTLDEQILALARQQDRVILKNLSRTRVLTFGPGIPRPMAILALALRHENLFYGVLWVVYDAAHPFSEDEIRFLSTLAGQAALAAANARLFLSTEVGRQRLAAILASTPDPVLVTDHKHRLLLANPAAWQAVGLEVETGQGRPIDQVTTQQELIKLLRQSSDKKESAEVTLADGRIYLATASSVMAEGRRVGRVCVMRDVTHFKELDSLKSEFVATVSHDLRSPLTLMRGYATMLEMVGNLNEQQTGYVRKIVTSVETMSRLVNNLLDLGRIEAGVDLQLEMVPVHDIADKVVGALQLQATQKRIQISVEIPPHTIPLVEADQALLYQGLYNLVENAIKYTPQDGKVDFKIEVRQDSMVFQVSDTGIGIAPVDIPRLFEKFYRGAQKEAKKQVGSGLGLAIVKSIADRHKGRVWVESQLGKGSTFYLAIPLRQPRREPQPAAPKP
jgi:PAS domain S-box-containing protein